MSDISFESFRLYEIYPSETRVDNTPIDWVLNINGVHLDKITNELFSSFMFVLKPIMIVSSCENWIVLNDAPECIAYDDELDKLLHCIKINNHT